MDFPPELRFVGQGMMNPLYAEGTPLSFKARTANLEPKSLN